MNPRSLRVKRLFSPGTVIYSSGKDEIGLVITNDDSINVYWNRSGLICHRAVDTFTWIVVN